MLLQETGSEILWEYVIQDAVSPSNTLLFSSHSDERHRKTFSGNSRMHLQGKAIYSPHQRDDWQHGVPQESKWALKWQCLRPASEHPRRKHLCCHRWWGTFPAKAKWRKRPSESSLTLEEREKSDDKGKEYRTGRGKCLCLKQLHSSAYCNNC